MTKAELEQSKKITAAATEGPWGIWVDVSGNYRIEDPSHKCITDEPSFEFATHARTALPAAEDMLERAMLCFLDEDADNSVEADRLIAEYHGTEQTEEHTHNWGASSEWGVIIGVSRCLICGKVSKSSDFKREQLPAVEQKGEAE